MFLCVVYYLLAQLYNFYLYRAVWSFFLIFDPSWRFSFHHRVYGLFCTIFKLHWTKCTCLKLESKWIIVFSFSFSSLFWKTKSNQVSFWSLENILLQSVVQSTNRFSIVPINVASFFFPFDQSQHYFCVIFNEEFDLLPNTIIMSRPKKKAHAQTGWVGCFVKLFVSI